MVLVILWFVGSVLLAVFPPPSTLAWWGYLYPPPMVVPTIKVTHSWLVGRGFRDGSVPISSVKNLGDWCVVAFRLLGNWGSDYLMHLGEGSGGGDGVQRVEPERGECLGDVLPRRGSWRSYLGSLMGDVVQNLEELRFEDEEDEALVVDARVATQLRNFIGKFLEYDATTISLGYRGESLASGGGRVSSVSTALGRGIESTSKAPKPKLVVKTKFDRISKVAKKNSEDVIMTGDKENNPMEKAYNAKRQTFLVILMKSCSLQRKEVVWPQMEEFRVALSECGLDDIGFSGEHFMEDMSIEAHARTMKEMSPLKSPGANGLGAVFYKRRIGMKGFFSLKLDMSKAYDRVKWPFIWVVMRSLVGEEFHHQRGLRLGDPLSPYVFAFYSEGLSALIRQAVVRGSLKGVRINRYTPLVTHFMFVDNCIIFGELEGVNARFWWQKSPKQKEIHWCSWKSLCTLKEQGGPGFRDLAKFNIALLAKQGWKLINGLGSLMSRLVQAKYFQSIDFWHAQLGSPPSYIWRSIWSSRKIVEMGVRWRVGSDKHVVTIMWAIWYMRNQQLHTGKSTGIEALTSFIKNHTQEFELAQRRFQASFPPQHVHWKLPRALWVKANFDASFNQASRNGWSGVNVRDEEGNILGSCKKKVIRITSSFAAEAMTAVHAIQLVIDMGLTRVCFEEDSGAVIQRLASNEQDISERENNLRKSQRENDYRNVKMAIATRKSQCEMKIALRFSRCDFYFALRFSFRIAILSLR
ncbi:hypothetical protein F3Y22_tig00111095pilonHSYRG00971 [Hibiscus syriacus]|uniref:RNase H type-1 domain-containing protein n=1 Tax=Hibiscus syriacus TaxID=106335 RepID=A0A6A2Z3R8_HIBSY|nr:hypothetical protein F3Y22_tig00111095pilonHSYRG00971 [Hibiscus syriacus]